MAKAYFFGFEILIAVFLVSFTQWLLGVLLLFLPDIWLVKRRHKRAIGPQAPLFNLKLFIGKLETDSFVFFPHGSIVL